MKLSRCVSLQLLGLLLVVEGAEEYRLGAGRIYFAAPSDCPADWTKLRLRSHLEDLRKVGEHKKLLVKGIGGYKAANINIVCTYESEDERSFSENKNTAIYFDSLDNEMVLYTKDTSRSAVYDYIRHQILRSKGQFVLQDNVAMNLLLFLGGCTVCIQEQTVIDKFKRDNPNEEEWAKKFNNFFMPRKNVGIVQQFDQKAIVSARRVESLQAKTHGPFDAWNGDVYASRDDSFFIRLLKVRDEKNRTASSSFIVEYSGELGARKTRVIVELLNVRRMKERIRGPLVFDESCHQFAPLYLPARQFISFKLAEHPAVKTLGDIASWSRQDKTD
eukprot:GHVS01068695.1.p1 GENE.GHVS01068695.1~~GHVS01068695.1.p1  ORF type:complete len:331 (+),score=34.92 GHVS01068695.1:212-1204(+)